MEILTKEEIEKRLNSVVELLFRQINKIELRLLKLEEGVQNEKN